MWSKHFKHCSVCKKTSFKHVAKGLCNSCYLAVYRRKHRDRIAALKHAWYKRNVTFEKSRSQREQHHFSGVRQQALHRDNYRCQHCHSSVDLVVHHVDCKGRGHNHPDNSLSNLMTLCRRCHIQEHRSTLTLGKYGLLVKVAKSRLPGYRHTKSGRWSRRFDVCIICGRSDSKHTSRGRCSRCVQRKTANS